MPPFKIALIGAGPASLTLANILARHSLPFTLYESSPSIRSSGGSLDLHPTTGQAALREAGLWAQWLEHSRPEADSLKIVDLHSGAVLWDENSGDGPGPHDEKQSEAQRPEIDREMLVRMLVRMLVEGLPGGEGAVRLGRKVVGVVSAAASLSSSSSPHSKPRVVGVGEDDDNDNDTETAPKFDLHFSDGSVHHDFDLVVGGDGAWSNVRSFLSAAKPAYSGISAVEVWCNDLGANPWLEAYVGAGTTFAFGEGCAVMAQRQGDGGLRTYACLRCPEDFIETCGVGWSDKDAAREAYLERYFGGVARDLRRLVAESRDHLVARVLVELPVGFRWESRPGVTLIGDAAHVMTPFAGVGVNVGMTDALVLAREIVAASKGEKSLAKAVRDYEEDMFPRAEKFARKTAGGKDRHFKEGGSKEMADMLRAYWEKGELPQELQH